jgi:hypothetical protein
MTTTRPWRFLLFVLVTLTLGASNVGCIVSDIPPEDAALIGLSWFKDLVIGDKIRLDFTPPDGCYQNGLQVDCATMPK